MAERHGRTVSQIIFRFAIDVGMVPLTGTTDAEHMREDLDIFHFRLEAKEVGTIDTLITS
jgi:diketogulonate reductase-like aldo/keto reductase